MIFKSKKVKELEKLLEESEELLASKNKELEELKESYDIEKEYSKALSTKLNDMTKTIQILREVIDGKDKEYKRIINSAKGGYKKEINKKTKKIEELENKVKELSSGAYLRIPLKPQRVPKPEPIKIKSNFKTSNIARKHQQEIETDESKM